MRKLLLTGLFACIAVFSISQTTKDSCNLKVCVVNKSLYKIDKLIINNTLTIDSLDPNEKSSYKCSIGLFNSFKYDITFTRKKLFCRYTWAHIISQPIDYIGEKEIIEGRLELYLTIKKEGKDKYEIYFETKQLSTDLQTEQLK